MWLFQNLTEKISQSNNELVDSIENSIVISKDENKLQIGCSIKQLTSDPFENIDNS